MGISKYLDHESLGHEEDISASVGKDSCNSTSFSASPQGRTERNCLARAEKEKKQLIPHGDPRRVRMEPRRMETDSFGRNRRNCETDGINRKIFRQTELALGNEKGILY